MVERIIISDVVRRNVWKLNPGRNKSLQLFYAGDRRPAPNFIDRYGKYPCFRLDFRFDNEGKIRFVGDDRDFQSGVSAFYQELSQNFHYGLYFVAYKLIKDSQERVIESQERIIDTHCIPEGIHNIPLIAQVRLEATAQEWNRRYASLRLENLFSA